MKIKPLFDRVVVLPEKVKEENKFGIVLPELEKQKSCIGKVVAVGSGINLDGRKTDMQVSVGDRVLFSQYSFVEIEDGSIKYCILRQCDILCILQGEKDE